VTIPILSGRTLQLTTLDTPPAQRVRSMVADIKSECLRVQMDPGATSACVL